MPKGTRYGDKKILDLASIVEKTILILNKCVKAHCDRNLDQMEQYASEVIALENEADKVRRSMYEVLKSTTIHFASHDKAKLLDFLDKITDKAELLARFLVIFSEVEIPEDMKNDIFILNDSMVKAAGLIKQAVYSLWEDFDKASDLCKEIEQLREETRTLEFEMIKKLYKEIVDLDTKLKLREITSFLGIIVDKIEEAADFILFMVMKYKPL